MCKCIKELITIKKLMSLNAVPEMMQTSTITVQQIIQYTVSQRNAPLF